MRFYRAVGEEFFVYFRDFCGLEPDERVLDIGCGCGCMAVPLTRYMSSRGSYEGFDIVRDAVQRYRRNITSRYPNFKFRVADLFNKGYNPKGAIRAATYRLEYPDESFDFVYATPPFTHMLPEDMQRYLSELAAC